MRFDVYEETAGGTYCCLSTNFWKEALNKSKKININREPYIRDNKFRLTYKFKTNLWYKFKVVKTKTQIVAGLYPT